MTVHSIVLYNMAPIWYYWVSPIWSDLLRFGHIWSDLVIRVTRMAYAMHMDGRVHTRDGVGPIRIHGYSRVTNPTTNPNPITNMGCVCTPLSFNYG